MECNNMVKINVQHNSLFTGQHKWRAFCFITLSSIVGLAITVISLSNTDSAQAQATAQLAASTYQDLGLHPSPIHAQQTHLARANALEWASDATLVLATSNWANLDTAEVAENVNGWLYHFYSKTKSRKLFITIGADLSVQTEEQAIGLNEISPIIGLDNWLIDSSQALNAWYASEKAFFTNHHQDFEMAIQLRRVKNHANPIWMVVGLDKQTQKTHSIMIDATNGQTL